MKKHGKNMFAAGCRRRRHRTSESSTQSEALHKIQLSKEALKRLDEDPVLGNLAMTHDFAWELREEIGRQRNYLRETYECPPGRILKLFAERWKARIALSLCVEKAKLTLSETLSRVSYRRSSWSTHGAWILSLAGQPGWWRHWRPFFAPDLHHAGLIVQKVKIEETSYGSIYRLRYYNVSRNCVSGAGFELPRIPEGVERSMKYYKTKLAPLYRARGVKSAMRDQKNMAYEMFTARMLDRPENL